jgi:hypothetical protein
VTLPRLHGIEIHEQPWCPPSLRDAATDYLQFVANLVGAYNPVAPHLRAALRDAGEKTIVDLCSGGGGPWISLLSQFEDDAPRVVLTDFRPNREAFQHAVEISGGRIGFEPESVDVMNVPSRLRGFRTLFAAFHHFRPGEARAILADAADKGCGIAIFEGTERRVAQLLSMVFVVPIVVLIAMPFIRPFRWSRLAWTYLLPLAPLLIAFDGVVSCLRTYTEDEMRELADGLGGASYRWRVGIERKGPAVISYAIGSPVRGAQISR